MTLRGPLETTITVHAEPGVVLGTERHCNSRDQRSVVGIYSAVLGPKM
jgi:hypothetical protein